MAVLRSASPKPTNRRVEPGNEKPKAAIEPEKPKAAKAFELTIAAAGLYVSFLTWGYMQEKITGLAYENAATGSSARWTASYVLNSCMALASTLLAAVAFYAELQLRPAARASLSELPPPRTYIKPALSNTLASPIGYYALRFINFPMMLLAKSCKLVPVMFMGWLLNGETYSRTEVGAVVLISLGVALFTIKPKDLVTFGLQGAAAQFLSAADLAKAVGAAAAGSGDDDALTTRLVGVALVGTNLLFDGYTNSAQKRINSEHQSAANGAPSPFYTMFLMNGWSVLFMGSWLLVDLALATLLPSGFWRAAELADAAAFVKEYPQVWLDLLLFALANAVGQCFIFYIMRAFSPVVLVTLTVTRKFFSILFSIVRFGHAVYPWQYFGMAMLFTGLIAGDALGPQKKAAKKKAD